MHQGCTWTSMRMPRNSEIADTAVVLDILRYDKRDYYEYLLFGALGALGFAPFNLYPVFIAVFAWFLYNVFSRKTTFFQAVIFFTAYYIANLTWIIDPLKVDLARHFMLIPFAITLIPMYLAVQMLIPVLAVKFVRNILAKALVFSVVSSAVIYLHGHGRFGFPWVLPGYIWNSHELFMQTLSIYGIYGLSLVTMLIPSLIGAAAVLQSAEFSRKNASIAIISAVFLLFLGMCLFGLSRLAKNQTTYTNIAVRVVQPNIKHGEKKYREAMLNRLINLSKESESVADLIIWPEASFPYLYSESRPGLNSLMAEAFSDIAQECLISGVVREDSVTNEIYNSAVVINQFAQNVHTYDKIRLVPFGEYVPYRSALPFQNIANDIGDFAVGDAKYRIFDFRGLKIAMAICYESVFPLECMPNDRVAADVMVNLTNDGWFDVHGNQPHQHLQIVRARAVEMGVPLIRGANVGISAVFDALGREIKRLEIDRSQSMDCRIPVKLPQSTVYSELGDKVFGGVSILLLLIACIIA